tara:strand:+ start:3235 stop:3369 length:135 start_codon:yes stop_codon:yes gene_type:complete
VLAVGHVVSGVVRGRRGVRRGGPRRGGMVEEGVQAEEPGEEAGE